MKWDEEKLEKYHRWKKLINMSPSELEKFIDSEDGKIAGLSRKEASELGIKSGRDSARAIVRMLRTKKEDWTDNDYEWMNRQISFISRMLGNKGPLRDKNNKPTRKNLSLRIWGHNPEKLTEEANIWLNIYK